MAEGSPLQAYTSETRDQEQLSANKSVNTRDIVQKAIRGGGEYRPHFITHQPVYPKFTESFKNSFATLEA
jgi:hypothetical protein